MGEEVRLGSVRVVLLDERMVFLVWGVILPMLPMFRPLQSSYCFQHPFSWRLAHTITSPLSSPMASITLSADQHKNLDMRKVLGYSQHGCEKGAEGTECASRPILLLGLGFLLGPSSDTSLDGILGSRLGLR